MLALALVWVWLNPRVFSPPRRFDSWAARGVLGERFWLDRANRALPDHHLAWGRGLTVVSASGVPFLAYGLWVYDPMAVLLGLALAMGGKVWFVDRMVWLHHELAAAPPP